jgi:hypothetical protein
MAVAIGGLVALGYGAQRYAKIAEQRSQPRANIAQQVEGFIEVRRSLRRVADGWGEGGGNEMALESARNRALMLHRVDAAAYAETRRLYRDWLEGKLPAGDPAAVAFERKRDELAEVDLGRYESLDS